MRDHSVAHWCAALAVADLSGVRVRWENGMALYERWPQPVSLDIVRPRSSRSPLLIPQGRRDLYRGALRAIEWLKEMPSEQRDSEWHWLLGGEKDHIQIAARKAPNTIDSWDTYSLGRLFPGCLTGIPMTAWLPLLACHGAGLLEGGRQKWKRLRSMHPDVSNVFWCLKPSHWSDAATIAEWYRAGAEAGPFELRPVAGDMMSYCAIA